MHRTDQRVQPTRDRERLRGEISAVPISDCACTAARARNVGPADARRREVRPGVIRIGFTRIRGDPHVWDEIGGCRNGRLDRCGRERLRESGGIAARFFDVARPARVDAPSEVKHLPRDARARKRLHADVGAHVRRGRRDGKRARPRADLHAAPVFEDNGEAIGERVDRETIVRGDACGDEGCDCAECERRQIERPRLDRGALLPNEDRDISDRHDVDGVRVGGRDEVAGVDLAPRDEHVAVPVDDPREELNGRAHGRDVALHAHARVDLVSVASDGDARISDRRLAGRELRPINQRLARKALEDAIRDVDRFYGVDLPVADAHELRAVAAEELAGRRQSTAEPETPRRNARRAVALADRARLELPAVLHHERAHREARMRVLVDTTDEGEIDHFFDEGHL